MSTHNTLPAAPTEPLSTSLKPNTSGNKNTTARQWVTPDAPTGLESLPKQIVHQLVKRGFTFNLMMVGKSGLGKSTLLNSIFSSHLGDSHWKQFDSAKKTTEISVKTHWIAEQNVKVKLSIIDTPGRFSFCFFNKIQLKAL
jgi:predicted GTPase